MVNFAVVRQSWHPWSAWQGASSCSLRAPERGRSALVKLRVGGLSSDCPFPIRRGIARARPERAKCSGGELFVHGRRQRHPRRNSGSQVVYASTGHSSDAGTDTDDEDDLPKQTEDNKESDGADSAELPGPALISLPILSKPEPVLPKTTPWWKVRLGAGALWSLALFLGLLGIVWTADAFIWRVVRKPLAVNFLLSPFLASALLAAVSGYVALPTLKKLKMQQVIREEGPKAHYVKGGTPTMGGAFFIPTGVAACLLFFCGGSPEVWACCVATLGFGAIGLLDDALKVLLSHNNGLPGKLKFLLQVVLGWATTHFSLNRPLYAFVSKSMMQLPLGAGLVSGVFSAALRQGEVVRSGIAHQTHLPGMMETVSYAHLPVHFGNTSLKLLLGPLLHPALATFCFAAMSNALNLTDGLDGLAAGTAAAAYTGMAIAVLPISPDLTRFGLCMAGACLGFLVHNSHKAKVFMGDTGSLALGAGLAAMAIASGMYLPLLLCSGLFVAETVSVIAQVKWFKFTKRVYGQGQRLLKMAPLHHHLEFCGLSETEVVCISYVVAFALAIAGAWLGIASI